MIKPSTAARFSVEWLRARVKLAAGESVKERFQIWLADNLREPRQCQTHPATRLVLDQFAHAIRKAHKGDEEGSLPYGREPEIEPGTYHFESRLVCPACRCAAAHFPPSLCETSFETFDTSTAERMKALALCRDYAGQVNTHALGFALLVGLTGTGKTRLAANVVRAMAKPGSLYVRQAQLTAELRATYGRRTVEYADDGHPYEPESPLAIVQKSFFLVLDEIGCNPPAGDERAMLDELIKHRYDEHKPTLLISNLPLDQLKEYLGDALTDRIRHATGNGKFIMQFSGESFRRTSGEDYLSGRD